MKRLMSKSGSGTYSAGISGITSNYEASQRHILTAHAKGEFVEAMWNIVDRSGSDTERQQRDLRPRNISRSENQEKRTVEAFQSFVKPFHLEISHPLTSLSSGAAIQEEVRHDVLNALKNGKAQKEVLIRDRLNSHKDSPVFRPYQNEQVQDDGFHHTWKKLIESKQKVIQY